MKKTLFRQLLMYMMIFFVAACALCYIVIEFYFDDYYYARQKEILRASVDELAALYDSSDTDEIDTLIDSYYNRNGVIVYAYDEAQGQQMHGGMHGAGNMGAVSEITDENVGEFFITSSAQGNGQHTQWLSYMAQTPAGILLLGRISYESMDAVVALVQRFFLYFGIAVAVVFILFAYFFSRSISKPLSDLNAIAVKMGELDFSLRYKGKRRDEIGQLGSTLNRLTGELKNTITQLKSELSKGKTLEKMRTQFTAQVSHELQTPLAVIKGYAEALADHMYQEDDADKAYEILIDEAGKISNMVTDLLDLSQMESGAYVVRKRSFNLLALLKKIHEYYAALPSEKDFSISLIAETGDKAPCFGDPVRIEQAIRNILTNAIKHVAQGGNIDIRLGRDTGSMRIDIENDGRQIAEEDLPYIFDSYYQSKNEGRGTGLGPCAITRHIIKLHDGEIAAHNTESGVLFTITLPL